MKAINLKQFLVLITLLISITTTAQTVAFEYDEAGNRVLRDVIYLQPTIADSNNTKQVEAFEDNLGKTKVTISPNPNGGRFSVNLEEIDFKNPPQMYLHSINGTMIYENHKATTLTEIDISNRENGTYILSLIIGTERKTWKIIKQE